MNQYQFGPKLDLVLERVVDLTPAQIWAAWTTPELIKQWFTPAPWKTVECEIDLRPGGMFRTLMQGPDGQSFGGAGCYLEIVENQKLVWTDSLAPGYRPSLNPFFTAVILLEAVEGGTKYTAIGMHKDEEGRMKHEQMGFEAGWGKALDQLVELMTRIGGK